MLEIQRFQNSQQRQTSQASKPHHACDELVTTKDMGVYEKKVRRQSWGQGPDKDYNDQMDSEQEPYTKIHENLIRGFPRTNSKWGTRSGTIASHTQPT